MGVRRLLAILGGFVLVAASCAQGPTAPRGESGTPVAGGRIVEASISDVKTLQPVISTDTASSGAWGLVYIGLVRTNPDTGDTEPGLAEKFELSADGLAVTYTLRDGLVWSDGVSFTGEDYKYTVEAVARSKKTVRKSIFQDIVGWKDYVDGKTDSIGGLTVSPDGKVITIKLTKVFCPAITNLAGAGGGIVPKHHFTKYWDSKTTDTSKNIDDNPLNMAPPASMGPFVFKEHRPGDRITFTRNERYYRGAPLLDEYVIKVYADQTAIKAALLTGEVSFAGAQPQDVDELKRQDHLSFFSLPTRSYNYIGWNAGAAKAPWLRSREVRQALWHGINVDAIIQKIVLGHGRRVYSHTPPVSWAYDEEGLSKYPYDVAKAKQLLEQAGAKMGPDGVYRWTDGQKMRMRIETNQGNNVRETILQFAQEQYKQIGIEIEPLLESFPALLDRTDPGPDFESFILGWSLGIDPDSYSIWHSSQRGKNQFNDVEYVNPDVDRALEAGRNGPDCSREARKKQYKTVDQNLNRDAPYSFLYSGNTLTFANKAVQSFDPKPFSTGSAWNIERWWIRQ